MEVQANESEFTGNIIKYPTTKTRIKVFTASMFPTESNDFLAEQYIEKQINEFLSVGNRQYVKMDAIEIQKLVVVVLAYSEVE